MMEEETKLAGRVLNYSVPFEFKAWYRKEIMWEEGREGLLFLASKDKIVGFDSSPDMT